MSIDHVKEGFWRGSLRFFTALFDSVHGRRVAVSATTVTPCVPLLEGDAHAQTACA